MDCNQGGRWPAPLTVIQLLWLNLITAGALATEKADPDVMNQPLRRVKEPIIKTCLR